MDQQQGLRTIRKRVLMMHELQAEWIILKLLRFKDTSFGKILIKICKTSASGLAEVYAKRPIL